MSQIVNIIPDIICFDISLGYRQFMPQHIHNNNELYLNLGGSGVQVCEERILRMDKGDLFLFPDGQPHAASADEGIESQAVVINFDSEMFEKNTMGDNDIYRAVMMLSKKAREGSNLIRLEKSTVRSVASLMSRMSRECRLRQPGFKSLLKAKMLDLFLAVIRDRNQQEVMDDIFTRPHISDKLESVFRFIETNYMEKLTVDHAARLACLSRSHFHSVFREETGFTFVEYLHKIRIRNARQFLLETDMPIQQIGLACGFQSLSHFYRTFSALVGKSPRDFRISEGAS